MLEWYRHCYEPMADGLTGLVTWRRVALPRAGGIGDQEAWLMQALEAVAGEHRALAIEDAQRSRRRRREHAGSRRRRRAR